MTRPQNDHVVHTDSADGWTELPDIPGSRQTFTRESYRYEYFVNRSAGIWLDVGGRPWRTPSDYLAISSEYRLGTRSGRLVRPDYYDRMYGGVTPQYGTVVWTPFDAGYGLPAIDTSILNRLETQVMNKLASVDVNVGVELAESRQTLRMLANAARSAAAAFKAVKHGDVGGLARALGASDKKGVLPNFGDAIGKRRLEFEYGWKPLIQTTYNLVDTFQKGLKRAQVLSARKMHSDSYPVSDALGNPYQVSSVNGTSKRIHIVKIFASPKSESLDALGQLGLTNPAGILWELVPYSFVADWFIPVGDILQAASLTMSMNCLGGYRAAFQEQSISATEYIAEEYGFPGSFRGSKAITTFKSKGYWRQAYGVNFPWPKLYTRSPFSDDHVLNAGALLHQWTRKK